MKVQIKNVFSKSQSVSLLELECLAKYCKNPEVLNSIVLDNFANEVICEYVSNNRACSEKTLNLLAAHPSYKVRIIVARRSDNITSNKILLTLAYDRNVKVREILAQRTVNEGLRLLLLRGNSKNDSIVRTCLRRMQDMTRIAEFIISASDQDLLKYSDAIIANSNLSSLVLKSLITMVPHLCERHIENIKMHNNCTDDVIAELERKLCENEDFIISL